MTSSTTARSDPPKMMPRTRTLLLGFLFLPTVAFAATPVHTVQFAWIMGYKNFYEPAERMQVNAMALITSEGNPSRPASADEGWSVEYALYKKDSAKFSSEDFQGKGFPTQEKDWAIDFALPSGQGEYFLTISLFCTGKTKPCAQSAKSVRGVGDDETVPVKTETISFMIVEQGLGTLLTELEKPRPEIRRAWLTRDTSASCTVQLEEKKETCREFVLWLDVRNSKGLAPITSDGLHVSVATWSDRRRAFSEGRELKLYTYPNNPTEQFFAMPMRFMENALPRTDRYLIVATEKGTRVAKETSVTYKADSAPAPQISSASSSSAKAKMNVRTARRRQVPAPKTMQRETTRKSVLTR